MAVSVVVAAALSVMGASAINVRGKADSCQCLNWKETYGSGLVECGQGFEFTRATGYPHGFYPTAQGWLQLVQPKVVFKPMQGAMSAEFCGSFYERFDDTKCARASMDSSPTEWWGKSWCYVSSQCGSAMAVANTPVSVKLCEEGKDSLLSDMDPESLIAYGERMDFNVPGYFVKVSYPVDRSFFYDSGPSSKIAEIKASGQTVLVDAVDEHQTKMIIAGDKVYALPNSYEGFSCVAGCIYSFAPKDGLICYQGPQTAMTTLYNNVRQGMMQIMFANSELWSSPCKEHGFTMNFLGQTCYGNTFVNTLFLQPHMDDEHSYTAKFKQEHSEEEIKQASALMGCASCSPHC